MRIFSAQMMAAAVLCIPAPAPSSEFFEDFNDGTYDTDLWMARGLMSFDSGCCTLTNGAGLKLKVATWEPPLDMRAIMIGDGEVKFTLASNYWVKFSVTRSGTSWEAPNDGASTSTRPAGTTHDFQLSYDGSIVQLNVAGIILTTTRPPSLIGKRIEFSSPKSAKLDYIYVNVVAPLPPPLTITRSEDNVILRWPTVPPGFTLQSTTDPASEASWLAVSKTPVVVNGTNEVTERISGLFQFYTLAGP